MGDITGRYLLKERQRECNTGAGTRHAGTNAAHLAGEVNNRGSDHLEARLRRHTHSHSHSLTHRYPLRGGAYRETLTDFETVRTDY